jgi:hypothetical protein
MSCAAGASDAKCAAGAQLQRHLAADVEGVEDIEGFELVLFSSELKKRNKT